MPFTHLGRYEITGTLGRGAMGIVYRAHDPLIERTVAIKTVGCAGLTPAESEEFEKRFFREAKSAGRLNHPNIVTIHDIGRSDDLAFIAMEFLSGRSLREILDSGVVLPPARIAEIAAEIAEGLAFAHANDVVHRDIKPANIMVLDNGTVKIADFGVALLPGGSATLAGTAFGSPKYMSPEQIAGQQADGRSDIFSLGTVLYEMLTGRPPFSGDNLNAILYQVLNSAPPPPSSHNAGLPAGFDRIVARALEKDPEKRYQDAAQMAADLRQVGNTPDAMTQAQTVAPLPSTAGLPATTGGTDEATIRIDTVAPAAGSAGKRSRALLYGAALAALALLAGGLLLRPAVPPPAPGEARPQPASPVPSATAGGEEKNARQPAAPAPAAAEPKAADRKTAETKTAKPAPAEKPAAPAGDWKAALRADLAVCNQKSFFPRVACAEKARWKHCPGHWGSVEECTSETNERRPGS